MSTTANNISLANFIHEYNGIKFILLDDAKILVKHFSKENRKKNNGIEYKLSDNQKFLYSITRDKNGWVGDFIMNVVTKDELEKVK